MAKYRKRDIETLKKLTKCSCVRSTNGHWMDMPDMAHSSTIKRLVRLGLAKYIYDEKSELFSKGLHFACWTGLGELTEKGKKVLEEYK